MEKTIIWKVASGKYRNEMETDGTI